MISISLTRVADGLHQSIGQEQRHGIGKIVAVSLMIVIIAAVKGDELLVAVDENGFGGMPDGWCAQAGGDLEVTAVLKIIKFNPLFRRDNVADPTAIAEKRAA